MLIDVGVGGERGGENPYGKRKTAARRWHKALVTGVRLWRAAEAQKTTSQS
jgi:hypothetical protein